MHPDWSCNHTDWDIFLGRAKPATLINIDVRRNLFPESYSYP
jgi:hypothetical protein